ncbi:MAG TPA: hypothetical protein DCQ13_01995 [Firmicutes bacterium]|jgi:hypothetical protein|nr:hypothetical protein [Bacillota bacterium]NLH87565.1 hypothetical protein [Bacillota bacterium]HAN86396.1 hypothetical protein [Bacillota bacterium]
MDFGIFSGDARVIFAVGVAEESVSFESELDPPAAEIVTVAAHPEITGIELAENSASVEISVRSVLDYKDVKGAEHTWLVEDTVTCGMDLPGAVETDSVAGYMLDVIDFNDELLEDGKVWIHTCHLRMTVSAEREYCHI